MRYDEVDNGQWAVDIEPQGSGFRVQGSGKVIANCKLQKKVNSEEWRVASGECPGFGIQDSGFSFFTHPSSLILHPLQLPSPPAPLPKGEGTRVSLAPRRSPLAPRPSPLSTNSSFIIHHSAFTLVEMLVAVSIIVLLMFAAVRVLQPIAERRVREAARMVNVYISSARNRAMEIGRPCGVILRRATNTNTPTACTVLDQCEVPTTYAGDMINAVVRVQTVSFSPPTVRIKIRPNDFSNRLIRPGDLMQLNSQGPFYRMLYNASSSPPDFTPDADNYFQFSDASGPIGTDTDGDGFIDDPLLTLTLNPQETPMQQLPWPTVASGQWSGLVPFLILRQPVKSSAQPLQLPEGTVVDLQFSGTDGTPFTATDDVSIIFTSNGNVEGYYDNGIKPVTGPIFLLVGSRSRSRDFIANPLLNPSQDELPNWADLSSMWVTINYQTGMVSTSENSTYTGTPTWNSATTWAPFVIETRYIARQEQSMGGR